MSTAIPVPPRGYETIFERIVSGGDVEDWIVALYTRWSSTYISEVERQHGMTAKTIPRLRFVGVAPSFDKWPSEQIPGAIVISTGIAERPLKGGGAGQYRARFAMRTGVIASAREQGQTRRLARLYMAALRALLLQRQTLDGVGNGVDWLTESYEDLDYDDTRSLASGSATFTVEVADVTTMFAGPNLPDEPDDDPWALYPLVQDVEIEVDHVPPPDVLPPRE